MFSYCSSDPDEVNSSPTHKSRFAFWFVLNYRLQCFTPDQQVWLSRSFLVLFTPNRSSQGSYLFSAVWICLRFLEVASPSCSRRNARSQITKRMYDYVVHDTHTDAFLTSNNKELVWQVAFGERHHFKPPCWHCPQFDLLLTRVNTSTVVFWPL